MTQLKTSTTIAQWAPELRLLSLLVQGSNPRLLDEVDHLLTNSNCDAAVFRKLVIRHRVESTVANNLRQFPDGAAMAQISTLFKGRAGFLAKRLMLQEKVTAEISAMLSQNAIPHLLLKGAAVAARFYDNRYDRQYKDLDFLIAPEDLEKALGVAAGLGYHITAPDFALTPARLNALRFMACDIPLTRASDQTQIELHWRVETNPAILDWDLHTVQKHCATILVAGQGVAVLDAPSQFVYLCCHGAKHTWFRLRWLADISRMLQAMPLEETKRALAIADDAGCQGMVAVALHLAQEICGAALGPMLQEYMVKHLQQKSADFALCSIAGHDGRTHIRWRDIGFIWRRFIYHLSLKPQVNFKISIVYRAFLDPRDIGVLGLSASWVPLYCICAPVFGILRLIRRGL